MNNTSVPFTGRTNKLLTVKKEGRKKEGKKGGRKLGREGKCYLTEVCPAHSGFFVCLFFVTTNQPNSLIAVLALA